MRPALVTLLLLAVAILAPTSAVHGGTKAALLVNGNAEAGPGSPDERGVVAIPGWGVTGPFTAVRYGATGGFPAPGAGSPSGGSNFFAGGPASAESKASQVVPVSGSAAAIDASRVKAKLSAYLGGFEAQADAARVEAEFLDSTGARLGSFSIGPVTTADRGSKTRLLPRSAVADVPEGTRSIRVWMIATRSNGVYNDGYLDDVALELTEAPTPEQSVAGSYRWSAVAKRAARNGATGIAGAGRVTVATGGKVTKAQGSLVVLFSRGGVVEHWKLRTRAPGNVVQRSSATGIVRVVAEVVSADGAGKVACAADPIGIFTLVANTHGGIVALEQLCGEAHVLLDSARGSARTSLHKG